MQVKKVLEKQKTLIAGVLFVGAAFGAALWYLKRKNRTSQTYSFSYHSKKNVELDKQTLKSLLRFIRARYLNYLDLIVEYERRCASRLDNLKLKKMSSTVMGSLVEQDFGSMVNSLNLFALMTYGCDQDEFREAVEIRFKNDAKIQKLNSVNKDMLDKAYKGRSVEFEELPEPYKKLEVKKLYSFLKELYIQQDTKFLEVIRSFAKSGEKKINYINKKLMVEVRKIYGSDSVEKSIKQTFPELSGDEEVFINFFVLVKQLIGAGKEHSEAFKKLMEKRASFEDTLIKSPGEFSEQSIKDEYNSILPKDGE